MYANKMEDVNRLPKRGESWYEHKLPNKMIKHDSLEGQALLRSCSFQSEDLIHHFVKQKHRCLCGPCSLSIVSNALGLAEKFLMKDRLLSEEDIMEIEGIAKLDARIKIRDNGASLHTLEDAAKAIGLVTSLFHVFEETATASDEGEVRDGEGICDAIETFRKITKDALQGQSSLVLNYRMGILGYRDLGGHFSPVGAYSEQEDMLLILDTWPETPPAWVKLEYIYKAMAAIDPSSKQPRGFLVLSSL